jgi:hypothetical protein
LIHKLQPAGKGVWKTKRVTYEFVDITSSFAGEETLLGTKKIEACAN